MREAVELSRKGFPAPNPRVGAVVAREGSVVGRGHHDAAGGAHAEVVALQDAGELARGADMFVTLEPCDHHGKTPPCTEAVLRAGIGRVVCATPDPNAEAAGGNERLREAGLRVEAGLLEEEASEANRVFLARYRLGRPFVLLKAAVTLDGRIAAASGESRWITGPEARRRAHALRAEMGCVLVGSGTVAADDPSLTVREAPAKNQPLRVALDPEGGLSPDCRLLSDPEAPTLWVVARKVTVPLAGHAEAFLCDTRECGAFRLDALLMELARRGQIGVLVEGGGRTAESFFSQGLVDEVELHMAPKVLGSGTAWVEGKGVERLADAWRLTGLRCEPLGDGLKITARVER